MVAMVAPALHPVSFGDGQGDHAGERGGDMAAGQRQHLHRQADECDASRFACRGEIRVLRKRTVPRIDRVGVGVASRRHDLLDGQVRPHRVSRRADLLAFVGLEPVDGIAILVRIDRYRRCPEFERGAEGADRDFTAVGDQNLSEHLGIPLFGQRQQSVEQKG